MNQLEDLFARVLDGHEPSRTEVLALHERYCLSHGWYEAFDDAHVFMLPTVELLDTLTGYVGPRAERPVELFAGRGLISAGLRRRGVSIEAYDTIERPGVHGRDSLDVLEDVEPDLVLLSYMPDRPAYDHNRYCRAITSAPSVRTIIHLGNAGRMLIAALARGFTDRALKAPDGKQLSFPSCIDWYRAPMMRLGPKNDRDFLLTRDHSPEKETSVETS